MKKYCKPCQGLGHLCEASTDIDDEPLCAFCQDGEDCPQTQRQKEAAKRFGSANVPATLPGKQVIAKEEPMPEENALCARGCGLAVHRGRCKGSTFKATKRRERAARKPTLGKEEGVWVGVLAELDNPIEVADGKLQQLRAARQSIQAIAERYA